ncbi:MAG: hypothetical protein A4E32_00285 [Methanomassiliicoccales archaeon PtaU1.Bin124]|nr:MAG: hypothetical protein A4E32_00285 [Methanomassiliicoccales archaeon PtaU1.Bin124]
MIKEFVPEGKDVNFRRLYLKSVPFIMIIPVVIMVAVWWYLGLFYTMPWTWILFVGFIFLEILTYILIENVITVWTSPITFYSNGVETKRSIWNKVRKVSGFTERSMIDHFVFREFVMVSGRPTRHVVHVSMAMRSGKMRYIGSQEFEVAMVMKDVVERSYNMKAQWFGDGRTSAGPAKVGPTGPSGMPYCINCGSQLEEGSSFCMKCGGKQ